MWDQPETMSGVWDYDGHWVTISDGFRRLLGWSAAELQCAPFWEFLPPDDQDAMVESRELLMRVGGDCAPAPR